MSDIHNQFNSATFTNTIFDYGGKKIPKALGGFPVSPNVFIGRENDTQQIHEKLSTNDNLLLLVNGEGGIGKTTMVSQYYFEYSNYYSHLIWLVSETGISDAIMSLAISLDIRFQNNMAQTQKIREIIRVISTLKRPVLIIIDNANDMEDLDENFRILRQFHNTHILLTSRIEKYEDIPTHKVKHLDKKTANILFKHYYKAFKEEEQTLLDAVLEAIGYNTLVIELLAKNLNEFNTDIKAHYPLQKLLDDIQKKGVLAISKSTKVRSDYKLKPATSEAIISTMYDISELSNDEKQVLSVFGVLPATALPFHHLEQFLPNIEMLDKVVLKLSQKGWIDYDKDLKSFKTNPIISEIARTQNKGRIEKATEYLLSFLISKLKYQYGVGHIEGDFKEIKTIVSYAETFQINFNILNYNKTVLFDCLGNFYKTYADLEKALRFFEECSKLTKQLYDNDLTKISHKNGLAISYERLGDTYTALGNLEKALRFFDDYLRIMKELYESHPTDILVKSNLAISYSKLGTIYTDLGNLDKALQFFEKDMNLAKELYESNSTNMIFRNDLAISYERLGATHLGIGNVEQALQFFEDYLKLRKKLHESHPSHIGFKNGLAISYSRLGKIYIKLKNFEKALQFFEDYLKLRKILHDSHPTHISFKNGLAIAYIKLGGLYIDHLNQKEKGMPYLQKALVIYKELTRDFPSYVDFQKNYKLLVEYFESLK